MKLIKLIKKHRLILLSLAIVLPTIWPLFRVDFFRMHDFTHVARLIELDLALKAGQIPPRWASDFGWGYGMPLFHFYNPLPYYLAELLYLVKLPAVLSIKSIFGLNFLVGFYFMYFWAKEYWGKHGGLLAATAFTYLPYRAVQFYVRGTLNELTATTFIPLLFYSLKKKNILLISISITAIFLSHNVIALFTLIFLAIYYFFKLKDAKVWTISGIFAFGLSAFFILPAFFEKNLTAIENLTGGFFNYQFHFIYIRQLFSRAFAYGGSVLGPNDDISFQLGWPHLVLAIPAFIIWLKNFKTKKFNQPLTVIFLILAISIFLMTFHSKFIWDKLTLLQLAQFPWRLLAFAGSLLAFLSGSIFYLIKSKKVSLYLTTALIMSIISLNLCFFKPQEYSPNDLFYYTDLEKIQANMSGVLFDYLPKTAIRPDNEIPRQDLFETQATIKNITYKPGFISFASQVEQPSDFIFNQYYFPGWKGLVNHQPTALEIEKSLGRIKLNLPSGSNQVQIKLAKTNLQSWSDIISLVSWITLLAILFRSKYV